MKLQSFDITVHLLCLISWLTQVTASLFQVNITCFSNSPLFGNCFLHLLHWFFSWKPSMIKSWWQSIKWFHCSGSLMEIGILQYEQKSSEKFAKFTVCWCHCCWWDACEFEFHILSVVNLSNNWQENWGTAMPAPVKIPPNIVSDYVIFLIFLDPPPNVPKPKVSIPSVPLMPMMKWNAQKD